MALMVGSGLRQMAGNRSRSSAGSWSKVVSGSSVSPLARVTGNAWGAASSIFTCGPARARTLAIWLAACRISMGRATLVASAWG